MGETSPQKFNYAPLNIGSFRIAYDVGGAGYIGFYRDAPRELVATVVEQDMAITLSSLRKACARILFARSKSKRYVWVKGQLCPLRFFGVADSEIKKAEELKTLRRGKKWRPLKLTQLDRMRLAKHCPLHGRRHNLIEVTDASGKWYGPARWCVHPAPRH
jgi:hypothetical protein